MRFLSERLFFLAGTSLFGIHAVPFRVVGLATWFLVLGLASPLLEPVSLVPGLPESPLLCFWTTSYALVTPLAWSSSL